MIQLTWENNYKAYSKFKGRDNFFVDNPLLIAQDMSNAIDVSCFYWRNIGTIYKKYNAQRDINVLIENEPNNVELITLSVNGGNNALKERKIMFNLIKKEWKL